MSGRISPLLLLLIHCLIQSVRAWCAVGTAGKWHLMSLIFMRLHFFDQDNKLFLQTVDSAAVETMTKETPKSIHSISWTPQANPAQ